MTLTLVAALALGGLTVGLAAGWLVAAGAWVATRAGWLAGRPAGVRARLLAQARLAPLAGAALFVPVLLVAFLRFEPVRGHEVAGPALLGLAAVALLAVGEAVWAAVAVARATARVRRAWVASATPVTVEGWAGPAYELDELAPVAAVVGVRRPVLFISRRVVAGCSPGELSAIVAHERAHVDARDNLMRWAFCLTPGARLASRLAQALGAQWTAAAEESADHHARAAAGSQALASALIKVARLATGSPAPTAVASGFIGGDSLERRVRRVLAPESGTVAADRSARLTWLAPVVTTAAVVAVCASPWLKVVHGAFEHLVRSGS